VRVKAARTKPKSRARPTRAKGLAALRRQVARLEALAVEYRNAQASHARLATFPEQNPNMVIETDLDGRVTYLNPVAQSRFPDLWSKGASHPLLDNLRSIIAGFRDGHEAYVAREIDVGAEAFEQKICYAKTAGAARILVYVHDITRRKRAEEAIQKLAKRVVYAQEEERHRLSRELHDEAGQALTALKLSLELIAADLPPGADALRRNLTEAIALAESTKERVRLLAQGLRPPALDTVGLNLTLEAFCRDFSRRTQLSIDYRGEDVRGLSDAMNICLYRVLQEALTNVARHARATHVDVRLSRDGGLVRLTIADNGRGFSHDATRMLQRWAGIGLLGMRERVELLGGWLEIDSEPGRGVRTVANLPVEQRS
jgi:two-component system sensor kinase